MIRSVPHKISEVLNSGKLLKVNQFLVEYRRVAQLVMDHLWSTPYKDLDIQNNKLDCPTFITSSDLKFTDSWLSGRILNCVGNQVCSMMKAALEPQRKRLWRLGKLVEEGKSTVHLQRKIEDNPLIKPNCSHINAELNPQVCDFETGTHFDYFINIKPSRHRHIKIPVKLHRRDHKWGQKGKLLQSIRLTSDSIVLFYHVEETQISGSATVGCDQGLKTVVTLSDCQTTTTCPHGHDLSSIVSKLSRCKPGSKGFKRAQSHRKNYIHWSLNQLNFNDIKQVKLEKVYDLRRGQKSSRKLSHWTYPLIKQKLISLSQEKGFQLTEVDNVYRSQRCSQCGWVLKSNRKGKQFICSKCEFAEDADLNASYNLEQELFELPVDFRYKKLNVQGFYWTSDSCSEEHVVPHTN